MKPVLDVKARIHWKTFMSGFVSILEQSSEIGGSGNLSRPGNNPNREPTNSLNNHDYSELGGFYQVHAYNMLHIVDEFRVESSN